MEKVGKYKKVLAEYENLLNDIDNLIDESPFKLNFIIEKLGLTRGTFYHKRKKNNFTLNEMQTMLSLFEQVA